ncbi:MAG: phosphohydrolase [Chloroflexi bacterium]|nr:phosphohydrolase [Chloroflexota bacterium]
MDLSNKSCPGSRIFKEPMPEYVACSRCGTEVEIWTDEMKATCPKCKTPVFRDRAPSCIDWCAYAKECVGEETLLRLRGETAAKDQDSDRS